MASRVNNSLRAAKVLNLKNGRVSLADRLNRRDRNDWFQFRLPQRSAVTIKLDGLRNNVDLVLLNGRGQVIQRSAQTGRRPEQLQRQLSPGNYYVRILKTGRNASGYRLAIATAPAIVNPGSTNPRTESRPGFNIELDYRYDSQGWFTPERRRALEAAATIWENIIQDEFPDLPVGTGAATFRDPTTRTLVRNYRTDAPIDDLKIFVGARRLNFSGFGRVTLGLTETVSWSPNASRYSGENGAKYQPTLSTIAFETGTSANWFFDPTPESATDIPANQNDFISVAAHEIGHALGIGLSPAFSRLSAGGAFTGPAARSLNGNNPVPLDRGGGHVVSSTATTGDPLMSPLIVQGKRKLPTALDIALLSDIGYAVNYSSAARNATRNATLLRSPVVGASSMNKTSVDLSSWGNQRRSQGYSYCGCSGCLST
jgi:hypothetical protein